MDTASITVLSMTRLRSQDCSLIHRDKQKHHNRIPGTA